MTTKIKLNPLYKVLMGAFTLSIFSEGIILPIYAIFVQKVGGDLLDAGLAMGIFLISQGLFSILFHRLLWSHKKRMLFLVLGWLMWVIGIASYLIISSVWMLFVTQVLTALGNAIADPIFDQELASKTDKKIAEFEWGFFEGSRDIVSGLAAIVGAVIVSIWSFDALIYVMVLTASLSLSLIVLYSRLSKKVFS